MEATEELQQTKFEVHDLEGTHYVTATIRDGQFRAEAGAFAYLKGNIEIYCPIIVGPWTMLKAYLSDEEAIRPVYSGTGTVTLEGSLGGFHIAQFKSADWILESGSYWASDDGIDVSFHRESFWNAFWLGKGLFYLQTRVRGTGSVVVRTRGPVVTITLTPGMKFMAESDYVLARTANVGMFARGATRNFFGFLTSKEPFVREYELLSGETGELL